MKKTGPSRCPALKLQGGNAPSFPRSPAFLTASTLRVAYSMVTILCSSDDTTEIETEPPGSWIYDCSFENCAL